MLTGLALFEHMCKRARRSTETGNTLLPATHLDVQFNEVQEKLLNPSQRDYAIAELMKHADGEGAKQSMAKRKLDTMGNVRGHSGIGLLTVPWDCRCMIVAQIVSWLLCVVYA